MEAQDITYFGIDVGSKEYFVVWYSDNKTLIQKARLADYHDLLGLIRLKNSIIAIDAPSSCRKYKNRPRKCEDVLGIAGFFKTPYKRKQAQSWMISGFKLWEFLLRNGFKRASCAPIEGRYLIEVHPTLIFKSIVNQNLPPARWLASKNPASKQTKSGRFQRMNILKNKGFGSQVNALSIDYIDALIAAYTAEQAHRSRVKIFGDAEEGQIWVPA